MVNVLSDINTNRSSNDIGEKTGYILLGGGEESMRKRVEAVAKQIEKNLNRKVIITGYKFEIKKIKELLKETFDKDGVGESFDKVKFEEVLSYDTRTNISRIKKKKPELFKDIDKFIIPASKSHGHRIEMIFGRLFNKLDSQNYEFNDKLSESPNKFTLEFINSGEREVKYAGLAESIYRNVNPKILQYASIPFRPIKFVKGYLIPLIKENKNNKNNKSKRNMKDYILSFFHKSNKRYALA